MHLDFHGHLLKGDVTLLYPVLEHIPQLDPDVYYWCKYRLRIYGEEIIGSEESCILRAQLKSLLASIYSHWETIENFIPPASIEAAISEIEQMITISKGYPVMIWAYTNAFENDRWVKHALSALPPLPAMLEYFSLPHMKQRAVDSKNWDGQGSNEYNADKMYKRAYADFRKRRKRKGAIK